jgi:hypothetical protein
MPDLQKYTRYLERIWETQWLTNGGEFHEQFEERLRLYLGVEHLNLLVNGTIALLVALQALRINGGEVITTPFTFPATPHVLYWNNIRPVFCDIEKDTMTIDPVQIEKHITPDTKAILIHVMSKPSTRLPKNTACMSSMMPLMHLVLRFMADHYLSMEISQLSVFTQLNYFLRLKAGRLSVIPISRKNASDSYEILELPMRNTSSARASMVR